jgi:hypothetical protein
VPAGKNESLHFEHLPARLLGGTHDLQHVVDLYQARLSYLDNHGSKESVADAAIFCRMLLVRLQLQVVSNGLFGHLCRLCSCKRLRRRQLYMHSLRLWRFTLVKAETATNGAKLAPCGAKLAQSGANRRQAVTVAAGGGGRRWWWRQVVAASGGARRRWWRQSVAPRASACAAAV